MSRIPYKNARTTKSKNSRPRISGKPSRVEDLDLLRGINYLFTKTIFINHIITGTKGIKMTQTNNKNPKTTWENFILDFFIYRIKINFPIAVSVPSLLIPKT